MESFEEHYASMCDAIKKHLPGADMALIDRAVDYANQKHKLQKRKDGSPYIIHPLAVAQIVAEMGLDCDAILGALLHDCIEDTDASHEDIAKIFGPTVAELVEGVTKLTRANFSSSEQAQMENLRKMFMAMSKDIRVMLIKIADRLHNMRTMQYQTPEKQIQKCRETMDDLRAPCPPPWYAEDQVGAGGYRSALPRRPWSYNEIDVLPVRPTRRSDEAFMRTIQDKITQRLTSVGHPQYHLRTDQARLLHLPEDAMPRARPLTSSTTFTLSGSLWTPSPTAITCWDTSTTCSAWCRDGSRTISPPPSPTCTSPCTPPSSALQGIPFEVQIRTWQMHETAEYGIAAHWKYKQGTGTGTEKELRVGAPPAGKPAGFRRGRVTSSP